MSAIRLARAATGRDEAAEVRRRLPRPRRRPARRGRQRPGDRRASPSSPGVPEAATHETVIVAVERRRGASRARSPSTSSPRSSPSPTRPTWASSRRSRASSSCCATRPTTTARCSSSTRSSPASASPPAARRSATGVMPDLTVMGKVIGGGLPAAAYGGSRALMERIAPAGDVYQAGTLSGNPLAVAAGLATLRLLDEPAYLRLAATTEALADGPARGRRRRRRPGRRSPRVPGLLTVFFTDEPRARLRGRRRPATPSAYARLVPRAAGARRLPAAVAVRGVVPVARPHRRARRAHARGRDRGVRGARVIALERARARLVARGRRPAGRRAAPTAARRAGRPRRRSRPRGPRAAGHAADLAARRRGGPRGLPPALRRRRACCAARTTISRCSPATACTRSASRGSPTLGDLDAVARARRRHRARRAGARGRRRRRSPTRSGRPVAPRSAGARPRAWTRPKMRRVQAIRGAPSAARRGAPGRRRPGAGALTGHASARRAPYHGRAVDFRPGHGSPPAP